MVGLRMYPRGREAGFFGRGVQGVGDVPEPPGHGCPMREVQLRKGAACRQRAHRVRRRELRARRHAQRLRKALLETGELLPGGFAGRRRSDGVGEVLREEPCYGGGAGVLDRGESGSAGLAVRGGCGRVQPRGELHERSDGTDVHFEALRVCFLPAGPTRQSRRAAAAQRNPLSRSGTFGSDDRENFHCSRMERCKNPRTGSTRYCKALREVV